jgi:hypothetical protein
MTDSLMIRRGEPMENARHERIAHALASGAKTAPLAWIEVYRRDIKTEAGRLSYVQKMTEAQKNAAQNIARRPDVKARVAAILKEWHDRRMSAEEDQFQFPKAAVLRGLVENYERAAGLVPVLENGVFMGVFKVDYKAANTSLELLGTELGMFIKQHKHLHQNANPLDGDRGEILGSLRVLTDRLSDADLRELGLQRLDTVEATSRRVNGAGDEQGETLPAVPQAG